MGRECSRRLVVATSSRRAQTGKQRPARAVDQPAVGKRLHRRRQHRDTQWFGAIDRSTCGVSINRLLQPKLRLEWSGSAAVGADMLRAAASGVRLTEIVTVGLVLLILTVVYRAPILVAIPLTSIAVSLVVATSVIALLARDPTDASGWGLGVFTTTRIFVVVFLFGAGTDFCLFFLRAVEKCSKPGHHAIATDWQRVVAQSWCSVHDALLASAMTTVVGLALMWFSDFQKFQYSGPIIAISLLVTLCVCLTFTPALLCGMAGGLFGHTAQAPRDWVTALGSDRATAATNARHNR